MHSVGYPVCCETRERASLFCCTEGCSKPAFGCSEECLAGHVAHIQMPWILVEKPIQQVCKDRGLLEHDLKSLERQEKSLLILIEELKELQKQHWKHLHTCRNRLHLRKTAKKLVDALGSRDTDTVTGSDMFRVLQFVQKNSLYSNQSQIESAINFRHSLVNKLIESLQQNISSYKLKLSALSIPQQFGKISPQVNFAKKDNNVKIANGIISIEQGFFRGTYKYPVMLKDPIKDGTSFTVQVIDAADKHFGIGVGISDLKRVKTFHQSKLNNLHIHGLNYLFVDGFETGPSGSLLDTGDLVTVRRNQQQIQWFLNDKALISAHIPKQLKEVQLYPVCWMTDFENPTQKSSKLKFI